MLVDLIKKNRVEAGGKNADGDREVGRQGCSEIAHAETQSRTHEEKTLRRFQFMRNQVGMDTGELTEPPGGPPYQS